MKRFLQTIAARITHINSRNLLTKACFLACTFVALACFSTTGKAQSLPIETQVYLDLTRVCLQRGDAACALTALQNAARISPQLARNPQLVQLARMLYARVQSQGGSSSSRSYTPSGGYRSPGSRSPEARESFVQTFRNPYLN